jgi:hypothetical protein
MNTVRVVTQTLVLVVACPASGAYVYRDLFDQRSGSTPALTSRHSPAVAAVARASQSRDAWRAVEWEAHDAEAPILVSLDSGCGHSGPSTPTFLSHLTAFDAPPSQRGPPALS